MLLVKYWFNFVYNALTIQRNLIEMEKNILFFLLFVFAAAGCTDKKQADFTLLGLYTPYQMYMEKLNGKVEKLVEINYWAVPDGESYRKGDKMTRKDLDSINYTGDFEATFDLTGDLVSCATMDENKKVYYKWEFTKANNMFSEARLYYNDTLRNFQKLKCNVAGDIIEAKIYRPLVDTLLGSWQSYRSVAGDTVTFKNYNYKGEMTSKAFFIYNSAGQFMGIQSYNKEGSFTGGNELKYDSEGKVSDIIFFDKDKKAVSGNSFIYEYDSRGNWIKVICKDPKGFAIIGERTYKYFE